MNKPDASSPSTRRWFRRAGRAIGSVVAGSWLLIGVLAFAADDEPWTWESSVLTGLVVASALAVVVAWRRQRLGAVLVLLCGAAHSLFAYSVSGHNKGLAMAVAGLPLLVAGSLLLAGSANPQ